MKMLLKYGANSNIYNKDGETAVHYACTYGDLVCVVILQSFGADFTARDFVGANALCWAEEPATLAYLLDHRLVNTQVKVTDNSDCVAYGASSFARTMMCLNRHLDMDERAINARDFAFEEIHFFCRALVLQGAVGLTQVKAQTLFKLCIQAGDLKALEYLMTQSRLPLSCRRDKVDLMITACSIGRLGSLRLLAVMQDWAPSIEHSVELYQAAKNYPEVREWLLKGRSTEQLRIEIGDGRETGNTRPWAGVWTVPAPLVGRYAKEAISDCSMKDFCHARQHINKQHLMIYAAHLCVPWANFFSPKEVDGDCGSAP
jgi:hypothetical protein